LEDLCLRGHEEPGVSTDLAELRVSETVLDDTVDEAERDRVVFHLGVVEIIEQKS
jgi:hypothetical protein